ncbi:MAG TPA: nucleotidyltransferase family protein [Burkholderiaceae bacterium]|nr:nucleotidyltransferase family protein [Burkholderiaceae bacterium]
MSDLLLRALRNPGLSASLSLPEWELLVRQARHADLLARLAYRLEVCGGMENVPAQPRRHLAAAQLLAHAQQEEVRREVRFIADALASVDTPVILLKGAAYVMAGLPSAEGRLFSDIDVLVERKQLNQAEAALMLAGWATTHHTPYDQRYYRQWMHEVPPLLHLRRQTVLDLHHTILPLTARLKPDAHKLIAAARPLAGHPKLWLLAPTDLILHSMTHLFHNEEMSHGLRDLSDLDLLLRHFGTEEGFWACLLERARELDLTRPLYYGLRYTACLLDTPVPPHVVARIEQHAPPNFLRPFMDALWKRGLRSLHCTATDGWSHSALGALYIRAHWLRMPPLLLARHLFVKATGLHERGGMRQRDQQQAA